MCKLDSCLLMSYDWEAQGCWGRQSHFQTCKLDILLMRAQRHLCCAFGIIWASLDGFSQNQRNLHGVGISHGKCIAQSPRQPRMTRESAILIHAFKPERHSGRMVRTQPGLPRPCRPNPAPIAPMRTQSILILARSRPARPL